MSRFCFAKFFFFYSFVSGLLIVLAVLAILGNEMLLLALANRPASVQSVLHSPSMFVVFLLFSQVGNMSMAWSQHPRNSLQAKSD